MPHPYSKASVSYTLETQNISIPSTLLIASQPLLYLLSSGVKEWNRREAKRQHLKTGQPHNGYRARNHPLERKKKTGSLETRKLYSRWTHVIHLALLLSHFYLRYDTCIWYLRCNRDDNFLKYKRDWIVDNYFQNVQQRDLLTWSLKLSQNLNLTLSTSGRAKERKNHGWQGHTTI